MGNYRSKGRKIEYIETEAYQVPSALIRLYSPQAHFSHHCAGSLNLTHSECKLQLPKSPVELSFPYNRTNSLPLMIRAPADRQASTALVIEEDLTTPLSQLYHSSQSASHPFEASLYPSVGRSAILHAVQDQYCSAVTDAANSNLKSAQIDLLK